MRNYILILLLALPAGLRGEVANVTIDHAYVEAQARRLATEPYDPDRGTVSKWFGRMDYDAYRRIRFRPEYSLWRDSGGAFQVQFFHPGYLFKHSVHLYEFSPGYSQEIPFVSGHFDYQDLHFPFWAKWGLDYAGFKVLNQLNQPGKWDEVISFLGASYFRALGKGQYYGLSARGIAINAGGPGEEEFPRFIAFWLGKPEADAKTVQIHALLDGPSVTGAYSFTLTPGEDTVVDVQATLYFRKLVPVLGIAPITSMYWFGEASPSRFGDFRPEVHDSDGLLVRAKGGPRIWCPLQGTLSMLLTDFPSASIRGFGLMQRDRDFHHYQDLEAHYESRPSLWVEPLGDWPEGRVRLLELPSRGEYDDNVVAFWTPAQAVEPGSGPLRLSWRLHWTRAPFLGGPPGYVVATRRQVTDGAQGRTRFIIDYAPGSVGALNEGQKLEPQVFVPERVRVIGKQLVRNPFDQSWRLTIRLAAKPGDPPAEIRAVLLRDGKPVTETWSQTWSP